MNNSLKNTPICTFAKGSWESPAAGCAVWVGSLKLFLEYGHSRLFGLCCRWPLWLSDILVKMCSVPRHPKVSP